jgi:flagellar basal body rod protein FlgG
MIDAISTSQLAMDVDQLKLQAISHNVANVNTPGFKKEILEHGAFNELLNPSTTQALQQMQQSQLNTQGSVTQTNNPNNLALSGEGYFQVQGDEGVYFTRRGDFHVSNKGELVTATGETVLGSGGAIQINDESFTIDKQGQLFVNHHKMDQIQIAHFERATPLRYVGNGLYQSDEAPNAAPGTTQILQGFIEQSNIKSIDEMMDMVATSRHFEANQRVMRTADSLLATAINQLGEGNV